MLTVEKYSSTKVFCVLAVKNIWLLPTSPCVLVENAKIKKNHVKSPMIPGMKEQTFTTLKGDGS